MSSTFNLYKENEDSEISFREKKSKIAFLEIVALLESTKQSTPAISYELEKDKNGKPWGKINVSSGEAITYGASISHSYPYVLCAIDTVNKNIGCDVESVRVLKDDFVQSFLSEEEIVAIKNSAYGYDDGVTFAWTIKESILKALGTGIHIHPKRLSVESVLEVDMKVGVYIGFLDGEKICIRIQKIFLLENFVGVVLTLE